MDEEIVLPKNKMYVIMSPIGEDQFNIMCVDKMDKPINELYYNVTRKIKDNKEGITK